MDVVDARMLRKSGEGNDNRVYYEAAWEAALVAAAKSSDQNAFVELHCRYRSLMKRRIRGMVRNLEDAEDVLQDTMTSAFKLLPGFRGKCSFLPGFRGKCSFRTWITTIEINTSSCPEGHPLRLQGC